MVLDRTTIVDDLRLPERLAIWTLRCVDQAPRTCMARDSNLARDLQPVIKALQACQKQMVAQRQAGLRLAAAGSRHVTRDEHRLLRAVAAMQAGATELADNLLFRFAPSQSIRPGLTHAVTALAATLGTEGHWLDQPPEPWVFAAGSLPAASAFENA